MKKLVIFDLDGTLLDTIDDLGEAANHALRTLGYPERKREEYYLLAGRGITNLLKSALPAGEDTEENVSLIRKHFLAHYNVHLCDKTHPYPGIPGLLESISAAGVRVAVASNKFQSGAETVVGHFFPTIPFVTILGQREGYPIKPNPGIVDLCMEAAGVTKDGVLYVGDTNVDMQTGLNAGIDTVGVTWGFRTREELEACGPLAVVDTPEELETLILR